MLPPDTPLSVTVTLDNTSQKISTLPANPELVIKKSLNNHGKEELELDGKMIPIGEWLSLLQRAGLMVHAPINFVLQGKAKQAALLDERSLFDLYSEIVGTAAYARCRHEAQDILVGTSSDAQKSWEILEEFRESLSELEVDKEDYAKYEDSIKSSNSRKIKKNQERLQKSISNVAVLSKNVSDLLRDEQEFKERLESANDEVNRLERDLTEADTIVQRIKSELLRLGVSQDELNLNDHYTSMRDFAIPSSSNNPEEPTLNLAPSELETLLRENKQKRAELIVQYASQTKELNKLKESYQSKKLALAEISMEAESSPEDRKSKLQGEVEALRAEIAALREDLDQVNSELATQEENIKTNQSLLGGLYSDKDKHSSAIEELISKSALKRGRRNEVSSEIVRLGTELCSLKHKQDQCLAEVADKKKALSAKSGDIQMNSLLKLKDALATRPINGVYGLLLDVVKFSEKISMALESLLGPKLFSFVVRDQEAANQLISLNKQIQGGRILVYPLTWMDESITDTDEQDAAGFKQGSFRNIGFNYPDTKADRCIILETHVEVASPVLKEDKFMHRLLASLLKGLLMVPDLEVANKLAKTFECDCVTSAGEIVYAKGFLNKLGSVAARNNSLGYYLKYTSAIKALNENQLKLKGFEDQYQELKNEELQLINEIQEISLEKEKQARMLSRVWEELNDYQNAVLTSRQGVQELTERQESLQSTISQVEEQHALLKTRLASKSAAGELGRDPEQARLQMASIMEQLSIDKQLLMSKNALLRDLQEEIGRLDRRERNLSEKKVWSDKQQQIRQFRDKESSFFSKNARKNEELIRELSRRLELQENKRKDIRAALSSAAENRLRAEEIVSTKQQSLKKAMLDLQGQNQTRFDLEISTDTFVNKLNSLQLDGRSAEHAAAVRKLEAVKDVDLVGKLKQLMIAKLRYTAKDKANFEQLERFFALHSELDSELKDLSEGKVAFSELTGKFPLNTGVADKKAQQTNQTRFSAFRKSLAALFKRFCPAGRCDAELLLTDEGDSRGAPKSQRGTLKVKCTFEAKSHGSSRPLTQMAPRPPSLRNPTNKPSPKVRRLC